MCRFNALTLILVVASVSCKNAPFYRRDYKYVKQYDAFYKLHQAANDWVAAFETCDTEGAQLFYPSTVEEASVLLELVKASGKNVNSVILGFRGDFRLNEFITLHGEPTPFPILNNPEANTEASTISCMFLDTDMNYYKSSCNERHSFICKRFIDAPECPTTDKEYSYLNGTGRCYKVHKREISWWEALATCYNEGGFLLTPDDIIDKERFSQILLITKNYYIGMRRIGHGNDLYTIKGSRTTLDELQLSNIPRVDSNDCVAVSLDFQRSYHNPVDNPMDYGSQVDINSSVRKHDIVIVIKYQTVDCDALLPFVCQMKAQSTD